jgi:fumarate reductase subunit C
LKNYTIESNKKRKSRMPARLDLLQSLTGLILGLFIWVHIFLDSSIIFGEAAFSFVSRNLEFAFLSETGHGYPIVVFAAVLIIFTLFIIHAVLGVRKIPISWEQHRIIVEQMQGMKHPDTNLWYVQVVTGVIMFFAGSAHLFTILLNPGTIDSYLSADRMVSANMWALYLILLVGVGLHACIGLYRLMMKWNLFTGKNPKKFRQRLKKVRNIACIVFLGIGTIALIAFVVIGIQHKDHAGERYYKAVHASASHAPAETEDASAHAPAETEDASAQAPAETEDASAQAPTETEDASTQAPTETEDASTQAPTETEDASAQAPTETEDASAQAPAETEDASAQAPHSEEVVEQGAHDTGAEEAHEQASDTHEVSHEPEVQDDSHSEEKLEHDAHDTGAEEAHEQASDTHEVSHESEVQDDSHSEEKLEHDSHDSGTEDAHGHSSDTHEESDGHESQHGSDAETEKEDHGHQTDSHTTKHQ